MIQVTFDKKLCDECGRRARTHRINSRCDIFFLPFSLSLSHSFFLSFFLFLSVEFSFFSFLFFFWPARFRIFFVFVCFFFWFLGLKKKGHFALRPSVERERERKKTKNQWKKERMKKKTTQERRKKDPQAGRVIDYAIKTGRYWPKGRRPIAGRRSCRGLWSTNHRRAFDHLPTVNTSCSIERWWIKNTK